MSRTRSPSLSSRLGQFEPGRTVDQIYSYHLFILLGPTPRHKADHGHDRERGKEILSLQHRTDVRTFSDQGQIA